MSDERCSSWAIGSISEYVELKVALFVVSYAALSACSPNKITVCAGIGLARNSPADTTIAVGQAFVARFYEGGTCVGQEATTTHLDLVPINTWYTLDTLVIRVDSASGRVTGRTVGDARLTSLQHGFLIPVHVR